MERLQAALANARQSRSKPQRGRSMGLSTRQDRVKSTTTEQLWADLESIDVDPKLLADNRIVSLNASQAAAPFDILRTKLLLRMRQNGWKRLAVTSPMPQSGKTTTSINLALGFGRQKELKTALFDFDLRSPSVSRVLNHTPKRSVIDVLEGRTAFEDQALRIGKNLVVSMATTPENDPARILLSDQTEAVLDDVQTRYQPDIMIFDLPSVLVNDDTRAFLNSVDCALIIARANTTRYKQFDVCEREIAEHTNVLGVVLNACRQNYGSS